MCGVAGIWDRRRKSAPTAVTAVAEAMTDTLRHRGPDEGAVFADAEAWFALGHRRLSIIELSPAGAQPMISSCGRFVISYNGEVYNAAELRPELEAAGRRFRGHCDTEVIVEGAAVWGVEATVRRLIGMFAIALWDRRDRVLYLIRDRLGIKPLYWADFDGRVLFGSELKALRADSGWTPALDRDASRHIFASAMCRRRTRSIAGVHKLPPGTILDHARARRSRDRALLVARRRRARGAVGAARHQRGRGRRSGSMRCCEMRSGGGWWRTCRWARSSRAASIPLPSWR